MSVVLIIHLTLEPYTFALPASLAPAALWQEFWGGLSDPADIINNLVFFIPLGLSLWWLLHRRPVVVKLLTALLVGAALSLAVEIIQLFLPVRTATPADVLSNTIGCLIGLAIGALAQAWTRSRATLAVGLTVYLLLAVGALSIRSPGTDLTTWSPEYLLLIGNERTGDRPWAGEVVQLQIASRALADPATAADLPLIASYRRVDGIGYRDETDTLPPLVPYTPASGQPANTTTATWFATAAPPTLLHQRLVASGEFTLLVTVQTADIEQYGPARIVSYSDSTRLRNFTLGQDGSDLIVRLRTPITGANGAWPQLRVPGVFRDTTPRDLIVSYADGHVRLFVDGSLSPYTLRLSRELWLISFIVPPELFAIINEQLPFQTESAVALPKLICYGLLYIPAGLLFAALRPARARARWRAVVTGLLLGVAMVASVQGIIWVAAFEPPTILQTLLGIVLVCAAYLFFGAARRPPSPVAHPVL